MKKLKQEYTVQLKVVIEADRPEGLVEGLKHIKTYPPGVELTACDLKAGCYRIKTKKGLTLLPAGRWAKCKPAPKSGRVARRDDQR